MIISQIRSLTFSFKNRNPLSQLTGYSQVYFSLYTFDFSRLQFHLFIHNNREDCSSQQAIHLLHQCKQKVEASRGTDTPLSIPLSRTESHVDQLLPPVSGQSPSKPLG